MKRKKIETCEMCSAEIANPTTIKVEGALLRVCQRCTSFGNIVREKAPVGKQRKVVPTKSRVRTTAKRSFSSKPAKQDAELASDYHQLIRQARQKKKIDHEKLATMTGISVASLKSIESGKMRPTDRDARKLERELGIELLFALEQELEFADKTKKKATTLGDIAVIKKFDYKKY